jgi:D-glycero-D-manno-heptose 1,7-bisphosphate phosphatase
VGVDEVTQSGTAPLAAVFLDRDGVLNEVVMRGETPCPPARVEDMQLLPGVAAACAHLRAAGYPLVVVTNQPDVARGTQTRERVEAINARVKDLLPVEDVLTCYHDDPDGCVCRKPKPGLLLQAAARFALSLPGSVMIGDRWSDVEAGRAAGARTIYIDRGYGQRHRCTPDRVAADLPAASRIILQGEW